MMTLGLEHAAPPPEQVSAETEIAGEAKEPSGVWNILSCLGFDDALGEALFQPEVLLFLGIVVLACVVLFFVVTGVSALVQEALSSGGPPQTLGLGG